ncbi:hypothetical protein GGR54DRAFT_96437 [Hypoxylon sp. NC1633]|nr:hypothetical protein GGR54DRAFT_96437 [Hypoxylon sp. NC1633]
MPWSETKPGYWQRPLGENERMIKWIGDRAHATGREHWSITAVGSFTLSGSLNEGSLTAKLRNAWKLLRFQHPSIASTAGSDTLDYIVPQAEDLEQWTNETLRTIETTAEDLIADLKPSSYVAGYFLPHTTQFVLHTAHWRTDGYGALQLLNAFFEALVSDLDATDAAWGDEHIRLVPSIEEVLELPEKATPEIQAATAECLKSGALVVGSIGLPYNEAPGTTPRGTRSIRRTLSRLSTASILLNCASRNITPLSAVHASLASANYANCTSGPDGAGHYTSTMRFSLRPYLKEPFNSVQYASALYTGSYMAKVARTNSWEENAAQYNELYAAGLDRGFLISRRQFAIQISALLERTGDLGPPRSEVDISSINDADKLVKRVHHRGGREEDALEVTDINLALECLAKETYLFFWIFNDRIEFNLVYNEAFYEKTFMTEIMNAIEHALKQGLGSTV